MEGRSGGAALEGLGTGVGSAQGSLALEVPSWVASSCGGDGRGDPCLGREEALRGVVAPAGSCISLAGLFIEVSSPAGGCDD